MAAHGAFAVVEFLCQADDGSASSYRLEQHGFGIVQLCRWPLSAGQCGHALSRLAREQDLPFHGPLDGLGHGQCRGVDMDDAGGSRHECSDVVIQEQGRENGDHDVVGINCSCREFGPTFLVLTADDDDAATAHLVRGVARGEPAIDQSIHNRFAVRRWTAEQLHFHVPQRSSSPPGRLETHPVPASERSQVKRVRFGTRCDRIGRVSTGTGGQERHQRAAKECCTDVG